MSQVCFPPLYDEAVKSEHIERDAVKAAALNYSAVSFVYGQVQFNNVGQIAFVANRDSTGYGAYGRGNQISGHILGPDYPGTWVSLGSFSASQTYFNNEYTDYYIVAKRIV